MDFKIETLSKDDSRLLEFRTDIYQKDLNLPIELMSEDKPHSWWVKNVDPAKIEDAFKYCHRKWNTVEFDNIEAILENNRIVGISGCKMYGKFLRTSMHLYLLKSVRGKYAGIKYLPGGWFSRHLSYAKSVGAEGMFFTVWPHNSKLKALINNHRGRIISLVDSSKLLYIKEIQEKGVYTFNGVDQHFFYFKLSTPIEEFNPYEFI